jgi:hypothetical protein
MLTLYVIINFSSSLVMSVASPWEFEIFTPALAPIVAPKAPPPLNVYKNRASEVWSTEGRAYTAASTSVAENELSARDDCSEDFVLISLTYASSSTWKWGIL